MRRMLLKSGMIAAALAVPPATQAAASPGVIDALGQCFERKAAGLPFSGSIVAIGPAGEFRRNAGFADDARRSPISSTTGFRLASVQKVLTATAIGLLVDQGRIALDDPIGKHLTGLPAELASATIEQLLHHRSGASSMTEINPETGAMIRNAKTARDLAAVVASQPLAFRPGERQQYSNGGYFLLGAIIEQVTGKTYPAYLEEAIFRPLGMTGTAIAADERTAAPQSKIAQRMRMMRPGVLIAGQNSRGTPAGNGVSTAEDLAKLGQALAGDKLISRSTREKLYPRKGDAWRIGQAGGTLGTNADLTVFPENGWVLALLSNYDPPAGELMAEALRGVILGKGCTPLTEKDRPSRLGIARPES